MSFSCLLHFQPVFVRSSRKQHRPADVRDPRPPLQCVCNQCRVEVSNVWFWVGGGMRRGEKWLLDCNEVWQMMCCPTTRHGGTTAALQCSARSHISAPTQEDGRKRRRGEVHQYLLTSVDIEDWCGHKVRFGAITLTQLSAAAQVPNCCTRRDASP